MSLARFALHGGAGVIDRQTLDVAREAQFRGALERIAAAAWVRLQQGVAALDVVEQAVCELEDCPLFNAGHGAVLNADGVAELDAAIMDGRDRAAGAVGACQRVRNPVLLARAILRQGEHVLLAGPAADRFAAELGLQLVDPGYFRTLERERQLQLAQAAGQIALDHDLAHAGSTDRIGTVGAVARDLAGNLAAATSTGGMTNKRPGRLGDSPIIGAGTWADNSSCAVSATGHGEYFMRCVLAHDVHARLQYGGATLAAAAAAALQQVALLGGSGGLIAIAANGDIELAMNSPGMYRAWVGADGVLQVGIHR